MKKTKAIIYFLIVCMMSALFPLYSTAETVDKNTATQNSISETDIGPEVIFSGLAANCPSAPVTLLIYSGHNYIPNSNQNIIFFDQSMTDSNGAYMFSVSKKALTDSYTIQVSPAGTDGVEILKSQKSDGTYIDFEDYTGGRPARFISSGSANVYKAEKIDEKHGTSLVVSNTANVRYEPTELMSTDRVIRTGFSIYAKDKTANSFYIRLLDGNWTTENIENDPYMFETFNAYTSDGISKLGYYQGSQGWNKISLCDWNANQWYDVELWLDALHKRIIYQIKQDGNIIATAQTDFAMTDGLKGMLFKFDNSSNMVLDNFYLEYCDWNKIELMIKNGESVPEELTYPLSVSVTSDRVGNIFFGGEDVKLNLNVRNLDVSQKEYNIIARIKDAEDRNIWTENYASKIDGLSTNAIEVKPDISKYGVYKMEIEFNGEVLHTADVSRCVQNNYLNEKVGVCAHYDRPGGDSKDTVDLAKAAGFGSIRADWWRTDVGDGSFADSYKSNPRFSAYISESDKIGVGKLALIQVNSKLYSDDDGGIYTTENLTALENYCEWFARTYKDSVKYIEVGNEVDYILNSDKTQTPPSDYAKALKAAYNGIKRGNPDAKVLLSAIYVKYDTRVVHNAGYDIDISYKCADYLREVLDSMKTEGKYYFDIVASHPYHDAQPPEVNDWWSNNLNWVTLGNRIKSILGEFGLNSGADKKAVWATELGYSDVMYGYTQEQVAAYLMRTLMLNEMYGFFDRVYFYCLYNEGSNPSESEHNFGLLNTWKNVSTPLSAKPAYLATAFYNKIIQDAKFIGTAPEISAVSGNKLYTAEFADNTRNIKVIWNTESGRNSERMTSESFSLGLKTTYIYDMYGNLIEKCKNKSSVTLTIGRGPIYMVSDNSPIVIENNGNQITSLDEFKSFKTANISYNGESGQNGILVIAQYQNEMLVDVQTEKIINGIAQKECEYKESCDKIKIMTLSSSNNIKPLAEYKQLGGEKQ